MLGKKSIIEHHQTRLRILSGCLKERDLFLKNGGQLLDATAQNLSYLYEDSTNDKILLNQYSCAQSLAAFLLEHMNLHGSLYQTFTKQKHKPGTAIPIISSLFLLGISKMSGAFLDKDIKYLFITSMLKDIGKYSSFKDNTVENNRGYELRSVEILRGRIPLSAEYLRIIENYHTLPRPLGNSLTTAIGTKTLLVGMTNLIGKSLQKSSSKKSLTLFESLSLVKKIIAEKYPREFELIISYFKTFFRE